MDQFRFLIMTFSVLQYIFTQLSHFEAFRWKELCVFRKRIINNVVFLASFSFTVDCFFPPVQSIAGEDCPVIRERNVCRFMFILVRLWKFYSLEEENSFNTVILLLFSQITMGIVGKASSFSIKWKHETLKLGSITEMN